MVGVSYSDKPRLKKGAWSPEEDRKLVAFIRRNGLWNWRELPKHAGLLRCGKSCRLRWMNYLRPNIKKGKYSREEEEIIINLHQSLGNKWAAIAAKLPGRTDNDIKNHWHTNLKKLLKHIPTESEATLHYKKITDFEDSSKRELEPNTFPPTDQTFRSSPLPPPPSSGVFSSLSTDENAVASEKLVELNGNFWTDPVLAGNSYIQDDFVDTLVDPGLLFPLSPISLGEPLFTYDSYNDDGFGWFN